MLRIVVVLILSLITVGCGTPAGSPTGEYQGEMFGSLPLLEGSRPATNTQISPALNTIGQLHRETVRNPRFGFFIRESALIDTMDEYESALFALGWNLVDVLEFGDGGWVRRYHRANERAILAFQEHEDSSTEFLLLYGEVQN